MIFKNGFSRPPEPRVPACLTLARVRREEDADPQAIKISLFRGTEGRIRGWYIGPLAYAPTGVTMPYLARSKATLASLAVVRAIEAAEAVGVAVYLVDPDDLWELVWRP